MKLTIRSEQDQPIFGRTHLTAAVSYETAVPSRGEIAQSIAETRGVGVELVSIRTIDGSFGGGNATADVYVYADSKKLAEIEHAHIVERTKKRLPKSSAPAAEAAPAEEAPAAEEAAEEAPEAAEEPKE